MNLVQWVYSNCKFAQNQPLDQQLVMDFDEPGTFTQNPKELKNAPSFHQDIQNTGVEEADPEFIGGFYHVTTNLPAVLQWGALKSRQQLGGQVQGLGGGFNNEAPNAISLTYSSQKAADLYDALQFAAMVAQNQITPSQIYDHVASRYSNAEPSLDQNLRGVLSNHIPRKIMKDEFLEGMEQALDASKALMTGEAKYEFMQQLDDAMGRDESEMDQGGGDFQPSNRVGFTAPFEIFSQINPQNIGILQLEVRKDASPEHVQAELELRFHPDDVRLAPNPIVRR